MFDGIVTIDDEKYGEIGAGERYTVHHWDEGRYGKENGVAYPADGPTTVIITAKTAFFMP